MTSFSNLRMETEFWSKYMLKYPARLLTGRMMVAGRVAIQRKPSVQAATPLNPVHRSSRGRNEKAACMRRTKKYMKEAYLRGSADGSFNVSNGFGRSRAAASASESRSMKA